jgi:hypothetical protein
MAPGGKFRAAYQEVILAIIEVIIIWHIAVCINAQYVCFISFVGEGAVLPVSTCWLSNTG